MSSKTLSTGTLSLRFMQNARNRQSEGVLLETAHVEDDGQWEVAKEVRESWGVAQSKSRPISSESSYLPFLFSSFPPAPDQGNSIADADIPHSDSKPLKGRRVFQKGKEVHEQIRPVTEANTAPHNEAGDEETERRVSDDVQRKVTQSTKGKKTTTRLTMLSKSKSGESAGQLKPGKSIAKSLPTAKLAIFDSSGVGTDLSSSTLLSSTTKSEKTATALPATFVKPAGVDDPHQSNSVVANAARERKRSLVVEQDGPKRKKKKKSSS
ncbi:hypothetical protein E1B28_002509 [Marasmius oreades]|uniref:Uncharacterized protein n=1 Tax=Marasmius oreades TaxID=181124 RepID=A0A9P7RMT3_9AGAR|nr:uncharacterized protein E1B28_002509 [Marasmius oreades]KAG7086561.1 hypothetical protein E1B28_002509 [Marasmius oreades]